MRPAVCDEVAIFCGSVDWKYSVCWPPIGCGEKYIGACVCVCECSRLRNVLGALGQCILRWILMPASLSHALCLHDAKQLRGV